jgi:hypothetical protein
MLKLVQIIVNKNMTKLFQKIQSATKSTFLFLKPSSIFLELAYYF